MESKIKPTFKKWMTITTLLLSSTIAAAFLFTSCGQATQAEGEEAVAQEVSWKIAQTWGPTLPVFNTPAEYVAEKVSEMSGGKFTIEIDHSTKHKAPAVFDIVQSGQYQMGHSASYYWKGKVANTLYFTTMPFGMTAIEQYAWFYHGGGIPLMREVYEPLGLLSFPGGNTGVQMGGWFNKKINNVKDFDGLKMRIPGFAGEVLSKLGANVVNLPSGELFLALERGNVDALEWVGPSLDFAMGFHQVAKYYYTGWHEPATELQFMVNLAAYNELPDEYKNMLEAAMRAAAYDMYVLSFHESAKNWETIKEEYPDIEVLTFPKPVLKALRKANNDLLKEFSQSDEQAARIIKSQQDYQVMIRKWTDLSETSYTRSVEE